MEFKKENYSLEIEDKNPFIKIIETDNSITSVGVNSNAIFFNEKNVVKKYKKEKMKTFTKHMSNITDICIYGDNVYSGDICGGIKLISDKRQVLRQYDEHEGRINQIIILDSTLVGSCSDDLSVKIYELSQSESIKTLTDHTDYIKSISVNSNILGTSSYDKNIFFYDKNSFEKINFLKTENQIFKINFVEENLILVGEGCFLSIYDLRNNKCVKSVQVHDKEVSDVMVYEGRIYSTGLDSSFKVFDMNLEMLDELSFESSVLKFTIFNDIPYLGMENGEIKSLKVERKIEKNKNLKKYNKIRYFTQFKVEVDGIENKFTKSNEIKSMVKKHEYKKCFDYIFEKNELNLIFGYLKYLEENNLLKKIILNRTENELIRIFDFMIKYFYRKEFFVIFIKILKIIIKVYKSIIFESMNLSEKILCLKELQEENDECSLVYTNIFKKIDCLLSKSSI
ncbi:U3 small nucleolar RNA-associated protein [Hamiltosporidium magnivora]|uniref:U3 small nucleolar RNA-associated protein n=1 Tax=Hamiltosporidium magnivora TaxID=148818 RepID=A0A4V2JWS0_9MICR|nr:U3 small nucleolar RNA-associated protein [Hamiltosporidium magnivora]